MARTQRQWTSGRPRDAGRRATFALALSLLALGGCRSTPLAPKGTSPSATNLPVLEQVAQATHLPLAPSNQRDWAPQHAVAPTAEWDGGTVNVRNVRNFDYITESDFLVRYYDKQYQLKDLESVDYVVTPFPAAPLLAHTMLSFGFRGGEYLVASVEVRLEKGETYSPLAGALRQFELIYVLADERDAIRLRTEVRHNDVYVYRVQAPPEQVRELFVDVMERVNQLHDQPEFYDTLSNNCTTNIVRHVNRLAPNRVPYDYEVLLPGLSAQYAYDLGLLDKSVPFEQLQQRSRVTDLAHRWRDEPDFSQRIRR